MGTWMAPSFANVFMGQVREVPFTLSNTQAHHLVEVQYIGDICHLDTRWRKNDKIYRRYQYISSDHWIYCRVVSGCRHAPQYKNNMWREPFGHWSSYQTNGHPPVPPLPKLPPLPLQDGIAYSQAIRLRRICSKSTDYERHVEVLKGYLVKRGYDEELIQQQINKATNTKGDKLLTSQPKKAGQLTPLVVTYHPDLSYLTHILHNTNVSLTFPHDYKVHYRNPPCRLPPPPTLGTF